MWIDKTDHAWQHSPILFGVGNSPCPLLVHSKDAQWISIDLLNYFFSSFGFHLLPHRLFDVRDSAWGCFDFKQNFRAAKVSHNSVRSNRLLTCTTNWFTPLYRSKFLHRIRRGFCNSQRDWPGDDRIYRSHQA